MVKELSFAEKTPLNLVMNIVRVGVMAIIGVLLVPFYIDQLGSAAYGIIPLATTISGYFTVMMDSLGSACMRYSTVAVRDTEDASKEISTSFFGVARICLLFLPLIIVFSYCTPWIFKIGSLAADDVRWMFLMILSSTLLYALSTSFVSVFNASNTNYRYDFVRTVYLLLQVGLIVSLFFFQSPSIIYIGVAFFVSALVTLVLMYVVAKITYPPMKISPKNHDPVLFRSISHLGFWGIVDRVGALMFYQASLVIVNIMLGVSFGGDFAIIATSVSMLNTICLSVVTSLNPHFYSAFADDDKDKLVDIATTALKLLGIFIAVPVAFIVIFSQELLTMWVGTGYADLYKILSIAVVCNIVFSISSVLEEIPAIYLKMKEMAIITLAFGIINIIACVIVLSFDLGLESVVWVTGIGTLVYGFARFYYNEQILDVSHTKFMRYVVHSAITLIVFIAIFWGIHELNFVGPQFFQLFGVALLVFIPFVLIALKWLFSEHEKKMIESTLPGSLKTAFIRLFE